MKNSPATLADRNRKRAHWKATIDPETVPKTIVRTCKGCKLEKPCEWNYTFTQTGVPEYRNRCKECYAKHVSDHRKKHRPRFTKMILRWRTKRKQKCVELLGGKCVKCGYCKSLCALTFHHEDPKKKVADVCRMIANASWDAVLEELKKCSLLCFNCHMEEHGEDGVG